MVKKIFSFVSLLAFTFVVVGAANAQDAEEKKHQWRLGVGPDGYWVDDMATGEGGLVINFAIGDGQGKVQKLFTFNSSVTGRYLTAGYQADFVFKWLRIGPGIMLNRWTDKTQIPNDMTLEDVLSKELLTSVSVQDQGSFKTVLWNDLTLVPYLGFGFAGEVDEHGGQGIYFTYRVGPVVWSRNPYAANHKSPFLHYGSWLFGFYKEF